MTDAPVTDSPVTDAQTAPAARKLPALFVGGPLDGVTKWLWPGTELYRWAVDRLGHCEHSWDYKNVLQSETAIIFVLKGEDGAAALAERYVR